MTVKAVLRNAAKPGNLRVIAAKMFKRFEPDSAQRAIEWSQARAIEVESFCRAIDESLWREAALVCENLRAHGNDIVARIPGKLGGAGPLELLYFLVRLNRPSIIVETGVAAGWSSHSLLAAIHANGCGQLYSSDFPYFRLENPEAYVGIVVPSDLRESWTLDIRGDSVALPAILARVPSVDLFCYDSDKSYSGREVAMKLVRARLSKHSVVVMDDLHNNDYFARLVETENLDYRVLKLRGEYVGVINMGGIDPDVWRRTWSGA